MFDSLVSIKAILNGWPQNELHIGAALLDGHIFEMQNVRLWVAFTD